MSAWARIKRKKNFLVLLFGCRCFTLGEEKSRKKNKMERGKRRRKWRKKEKEGGVVMESSLIYLGRGKAERKLVVEE